MGKRFTLEDLALMINQGFTNLDNRVSGLDLRVSGLEDGVLRLDGRLQKVEQRMDRLEIAVYEVQSAVTDFRDETKGVHKAIDSLDMRTTRIENHLGLVAEPAED